MGFRALPIRYEPRIIGAGEAPTAVLAVGARKRSLGPDWGAYTVDATALRRNAGVEHETSEAEPAYAHLPPQRPTRYRAGWLPG
jgi:hypothetical protein